LRSVAAASLGQAVEPPLINPNIPYDWGTGLFRHIADIRRRTYTTYYTLQEERHLLREMLGYFPEEHIERVLAEIENPLFNIEGKNYEVIKAYLRQRAREVFSEELATWEAQKDRLILNNSMALLDTFGASLEEWVSKPRPAKRWRKAVLKAAMVDLFNILEMKDAEATRQEIEAAIAQEGMATGMNLPIDATSELYAKVYRSSGRTALLAGDINTIALDMKLHAELLIRHQLERLAAETGLEDAALIQEAKRRGVGVSLFVNRNYVPRNNNQVIQRNATFKNVQELLALEQFAGLRKYAASGLFEVIPFRSDYPGTVLTDLQTEERRTLLRADNVIALGEQNQITLDGLNKRAFRIAPIRDFTHVFYTSLKYNKDEFKYPRFSIIEVPAGVRAAINYVPDLLTELSAIQFDRLRRVLPRAKWNRLAALARETPEANILDLALDADFISADEKRSIAAIKGPTAREKRERANQLIAEFGGRYARLDKSVDRYRHRVVHVVHFPQDGINARGEQLEMGIAYAQTDRDYKGQPKSKFTFDDLMKLEREAVFAFNFLYFITRNLIVYFNQANPHFELGQRFFGDAIGLMRATVDGKDVLYPPLFNKGAVGQKNDGSYVFGRVQLPQTGTVRLPVAGEARTLRWEQVNPAELGEEDRITMLTPFEDAYRDPNQWAPHVSGQRRNMYFTPEADRYNFVMINDKLLGVVRGKTEIPAYGTVLSVPRAVFDPATQATLDQEAAAVLEERKHVNEFTEVTFDFEFEEKWRDTRWIMGGALLMVDDGKVEGLDPDALSPEPNLYEIEGWALQSSQRSQETPVETNLNEARTTIGITEDGQFFLATIDGRSNDRTGATHTETVQWLQEYFQSIGTTLKYALDLDSASSVAIGYAADGQFNLLSQTARGSDSKLGDSRYYNNLAFLKAVPAEDNAASSLGKATEQAEAVETERIATDSIQTAVIDAPREADMISMTSVAPNRPDATELVLGPVKDTMIFVDARGLSDDQILELYSVAQALDRDASMIAYAAERGNPVRVLEGVNAEKLHVESLRLKEAMAKYVKRFEGSVLHLAAGRSDLDRDTFQKMLREKGIAPEAAISLAYQGEISGTLAAALEELPALLKHQLPDYFGVDALKRLVVTDLKYVAAWQQKFRANLILARAA